MKILRKSGISSDDRPASVRRSLATGAALVGLSTLGVATWGLAGGSANASTPSVQVSPTSMLRNGGVIQIFWRPDAPGSYIQQCSDYGCDETVGTAPGQTLIDNSFTPNGSALANYVVRTGEVGGGTCAANSWNCYIRVTYPAANPAGVVSMVYEKIYIGFGSWSQPYGQSSSWAYYSSSRPFVTTSTAPPTTLATATTAPSTTAPTTTVASPPPTQVVIVFANPTTVAPPTTQAPPTTAAADPTPIPVSIIPPSTVPPSTEAPTTAAPPTTAMSSPVAAPSTTVPAAQALSPEEVAAIPIAAPAAAGQSHVGVVKGVASAPATEELALTGSKNVLETTLAGLGCLLLGTALTGFRKTSRTRPRKSRA